MIETFKTVAICTLYGTLIFLGIYIIVATIVRVVKESIAEKRIQNFIEDVVIRSLTEEDSKKGKK